MSETIQNVPELDMEIQENGSPEAAKNVKKPSSRTARAEKKAEGKTGIKEALFHLQQNLSAPKNICNRERNFYYRSTDGILEAVKPLLREVGCILRFDDTIEVVAQGLLYIRSRVILENADGEMMDAVGFAREDFRDMGKGAAQQTGTATTYAHKLALNALLCIDDAKVDPTVDPDCSNRKGEDAEKKPEPVIPQTTPIDGLVTDSRDTLTPDHPKWVRAISVAGKRANAGKSRDAIRKEIEMKYIISDRDFGQLVADAGI